MSENAVCDILKQLEASYEAGVNHYFTGNPLLHAGSQELQKTLLKPSRNDS